MSSGNVTLMSYVLLRDRITTKLFIDCAQMLNKRSIVRPSAAPLLVLPEKKEAGANMEGFGVNLSTCGRNQSTDFP